MATSEELVLKIGKLSSIEKVRIVDTVIRDMMPSDSVIDKVWVRETSVRWNAYKRGETGSVPYEEVMSKYRT